MTVLNIVRLVVQTEFSDVRFDSPLIYNNLVAPDITIRQTAINGPEVAGHSSTECSNQAETSTEATSRISETDDEDCPLPQASAEDSEEEPAPSSRRRRRKRKPKAAARYLGSSSENEGCSRPLKRRRKQKHSVQTRDAELPGCSRKRKELAGRKRMYSKGWPRIGRENANKRVGAAKDAEEETLTGLLKTRRKTYKRPGQTEGSLCEEPVPGPSGRNTGLVKRKGKNFQLKASQPPSKDTKASAKAGQTERKKRKRARKDHKNPAKQPAASTTDSEEEPQPKPLRRRKKKERK